MKTIYDDKQEDDPLQKQFNNLQKEWDSIKQSISRSNRRSSTSTTVAGDHSLFYLYDDSPKELMSLLQNENTPTIEQPEAVFDDDNGIHGECFDVDEKSEVSTQFSCKGFENYDEKYNQLCGFGGSCTGSPAKRGVRAVAAKSSGGRGGGGGSVGKWFVSVVVMLFALAIVALECGSEHKSILVPT